jgi:hypothetical protein
MIGLTRTSSATVIYKMPAYYSHRSCKRYWSTETLIVSLRFSWQWLWRKPSSEMLRRVALVRTDVSEEFCVSIIRVCLRSVRLLLIRLTLFLVHRFLSPWWWMRYVPPKSLFLQEQHGVTSQRTSFFNWDIVCMSEVLTAVTMKNAVFWDIKTHFIPHRKHINSLLQGPAG